MDNRSYRQLDAWQKAMDTHDAAYLLSKDFPADERYGLTSQLRRSSLSVPSNIAEGYGRHHRKAYLQHLYIARGSLMESETQLIAAVRNGLCTREAAKTAWEQMQHTGKLLHRLIASLSSLEP